MPSVAFVRGVAAGLALALLCAASPARADKLDQTMQRLKANDDFRVRTQAALALGASKSKRAVAPLCRSLQDKSSAVRAASAAALGKLKQGGQDCLQRRLDAESSASVKSSIAKALAILTAERRPSEPQLTTDTKVYIAIGKTTNKTGRDGKQVHELVRSAMSKAAAQLSGYAIAPDGQTTAEAKKLLVKYKKLKAVYLSPKVKEPEYDGGNLTIRVEIAVFTYPAKALKGVFSKKLTQQDVPSKDEASENELIRMAAERLVEKLAQDVDRIN